MSATESTRPLLVGELNPYGAAPHFALYPRPRGASGDRLREIMGLRDGEYLGMFDRVNLCAGRWSIKDARAMAGELRAGKWTTFVLLGAKVRAAFGLDAIPTFSKAWGWDRLVSAESPAPIDAVQKLFVALPHPSGRCLIWNEADAVERARSVLRAARVLP